MLHVSFSHSVFSEHTYNPVHLRYIHRFAERIFLPSFFFRAKVHYRCNSMPEAGKNTVVQAMLRVAISENTKMNKSWKILISFCPFHKMLEIHQKFSLVLKKSDLKVFFPLSEPKAF